MCCWLVGRQYHYMPHAVSDTTTRRPSGASGETDKRKTMDKLQFISLVKAGLKLDTQLACWIRDTRIV